VAIFAFSDPIPEIEGIVFRRISSALVDTPLSWICMASIVTTGTARADAAEETFEPVTMNFSIFTSCSGGGVAVVEALDVESAGTCEAAGAVWATAWAERATLETNASDARNFLTEFRFIVLISFA